jgi:hypothetical protein
VDKLAGKLAAMPARPCRNQANHPHERIAHTSTRNSTSSATKMRRLGFTEDYREGVAAFLKTRSEIHWPMIISSRQVRDFR